MNHPTINNISSMQNLIEQQQTAQSYYLKLSTEVSDQQLGRWFKLYSEQKKHCIKKLERILEKLGQATGPSRYPNTSNAYEPIRRDIFSNEKAQLLSITKSQEKVIIQLYTNVILDNDLPDSVSLTLLRHRDQIGLALRYLDKIAA